MSDLWEGNPLRKALAIAAHGYLFGRVFRREQLPHKERGEQAIQGEIQDNQGELTMSNYEDNLAIRVILSELDTDPSLCDGAEVGNSIAGSLLSSGLLVRGARYPRQVAEGLARAALSQWRSENAIDAAK